MKYLILLSFLSLIACTTTPDDRFTYEEVNGVPHLEVTPDNLMRLYELSIGDERALLKNLGYEKMDGPYDFMLKTDTLGSDWQTVATRGVKANTFSISWVSPKDNDRLEKFRRLASQSPHLYNEKNNIYTLTGEGELYLVKIKDLIIAEEISIIAFPPFPKK